MSQGLAVLIVCFGVLLLSLGVAEKNALIAIYGGVLTVGGAFATFAPEVFR